MKSIKWFITILLFVLFVTPGYSLIIKSGPAIDVLEDEVIDDDLIAVGRVVTINGKVNGDVWALAQNVFIGGEIDGSIFTFGSSADINVRKAKTVMAGGGNIQVFGNIERNVLLFGGSLVLDKTAKVGKDLVVYGGQLNVRGTVRGRITGGVGGFVMEGRSSEVDIKAEQALIKSQAQISGNLIVRGEQAPIIEKGAQIMGVTKLEKTEITKKVEDKGIGAFASLIAYLISFIKIIALVASIIIGILVIALFKGFTRRIMDSLIKTPWRSLGWGFVGLIVIPAAIMISFLILVGYPIAIFGIYIYSILFYLSSIFVSMVLGEKIVRIFRKQGEISLYISFIIGSFLLFIPSLIPILGFLVKIFVLLFGAGMLLVGTWSLIKDMREKELV